MELYQLKCFLEVAKKENMSKAAKSLNISQPALSVSIKKLEEELKCSLFFREGRAIRKTPFANIIIPYIEKMLNYENEILELSLKESSSPLEIILEVHDAIPIIIEVVSKIHSEHPEIKIKMVNEKRDNEKADIIIDATHFIINQKDHYSIFKDKIMLAIPRILYQNYDEPIPYEFISENTLMGISNNYSFGEIENYYLSKCFEKVKHSIICDSPSMLRNLLSNGTGLAFVPEKTWGLKRNPSIALAHLEGPEWPIYINVKRSFFRNNNSLIDLFIKELSSQLDLL